jgi:hypothetical protein
VSRHGDRAFPQRVRVFSKTTVWRSCAVFRDRGQKSWPGCG